MSKVKDILVGKNTLLDTELKSISIYSERNNLCIKLSFENFRLDIDLDSIDLIFEGVIEYSLYHNQNYHFYTVEDYKFFQNDNEVYISLDPDDEIMEKSVDDKDFIIASNIVWKARYKGIK